MIDFKHEAREETEVVRRRESLSAEIDGFDVSVEFPDGRGAGYEVSIYPIPTRNVYGQRMPGLRLHSQHVDELERVGAVLPTVLAKLADGLRARGLGDLRSDMEREHEEFMANLRREVQGGTGGGA
jgi:hypothetical protein